MLLENFFDHLEFVNNELVTDADRPRIPGLVAAVVFSPVAATGL